MSHEDIAATAEGPVIVLEGALTVAAATGLRDRLIDCVAHAQTVQIRTAGVERIDTSVLQLVAVFIRQRAAAGLETEWVDASKNMSEALKVSGLEPYCGRLH